MLIFPIQMAKPPCLLVHFYNYLLNFVIILINLSIKAIEYGKKNILNILIQNGADLNKRDIYGTTL